MILIIYIFTLPNGKCIIYNNYLYNNVNDRFAYISDINLVNNKVDNINKYQLITSQTYTISNSTSKEHLSLPKPENQYHFVIYVAEVSNTSASHGSISIGRAVVFNQAAGNNKNFTYTQIISSQYCIYTSAGSSYTYIGLDMPYNTNDITISFSSIYNGNLRVDVFAY